MKSQARGKEKLREDWKSTSIPSAAGPYDYAKSYNPISHLSSELMSVEGGIDANSEKELGNEYFKQKKFNEAIDCYSRSIALSPTAVAYANRAMAYLKIKRFQEAENDCTKALNLDDRYTKAYSRRSTARKGLGKLKESIEDAEFALRLEPQNQEIKKQHAEVKALYEKGILKRVSGTTRVSEQGAQKSGKTSGPLVQSVSSSSQEVAEVRKIPAKGEDWSHTSELSTGPQVNATQQTGKSTLFRAAGPYDDAKNYNPNSQLSSELMSEEGNVDANSEKELGNEYFRQKKFNEAIDCYSRSIALSPTAVAYANRAMSYLIIKRFQEAENDCTEALNLDDRYTKAYSRRSTARKELGKLKESIEDAEFALRFEPQNQGIKKQYAEVKALYEKCKTRLSLNPTLLQVRQNKKPSMNQDSASLAVEDRISVLPRDVVDHILDLLPIKDAAKTCILSKSWRYVWAEFPKLVLDYDFCNELIEESESNFREVVDEILLLHTGSILKFVLDVNVKNSASYKAIDRWLLHVTRNSIKEVNLRVSNIGNLTYKLPSCVFSCRALTQLYLASCSFKPPASFLGFPNLVDLKLASVTFSESCVIKAPLLVDLTLNACNGTQHLNIVSPTLKILYVYYDHSSITLNRFINCKSLRELGLFFHDDVYRPNYAQRSMLVDLLVSLPELEVLMLDSLFIELLCIGVVRNGLPFMLNSLCCLSLDIDFSHLGQYYCALHLIKSCPNLIQLDVSVCGISDETIEEIVKNLEKSGCLGPDLGKLKYVNIHAFGSSRRELIFVIVLLSRAQYLETMCFKHPVCIDLVKMRGLNKASPTAELVVI